MGAKPAPPLPEPQPVTYQPDPDSEAQRALKDKKQRQLLAQDGRAGTLLSPDGAAFTEEQGFNRSLGG